jgi:hypothetical protein
MVRGKSAKLSGGKNIKDKYYYLLSQMSLYDLMMVYSKEEIVRLIDKVKVDKNSLCWYTWVPIE